jgi:hypothetical protein
VVSYVIGILGFPAIGGWLILASGTKVFLAVVLACAVAELGLAVVRRAMVRRA